MFLINRLLKEFSQLDINHDHISLERASQKTRLHLPYSPKIIIFNDKNSWNYF